jgi:hypothetical protein
MTFVRPDGRTCWNELSERGDDMASFEADIRPLFREGDRNEMLSVFDLWSLDDVRANAERILERLEAGDMPCDGSWPDDHVQRFSDWMSEGTPP